MTQDKIIRMASEAGAIKRYWGEGKEGFAFQTNEQLERFAALVTAHERELTYFRMRAAGEVAANVEREACAKVCEESRNNHRWDDYIEGCEDCAAAIRARS